MHQPNTAASSSRRAAASRANGALSRGPVTEAGKARSSQNARTHGFTAATDVLTHLESAANFQAHAARYFDYFQPANPVEHDLVERLVVSKWQIDRIIVARAAAISLEAIDTAHEVKKKYDSIAPDGQLALAFQSLDEKSNILANLSRYESRHVRDYDKALKLLNYNPAPLPPMLADDEHATPEPEDPTQGPTQEQNTIHPAPPEPAPNTGPAPHPASQPDPQPNPSLLLSLLLTLQFLWLFLNRTATQTLHILNPAPALAAIAHIQSLSPEPNHQVHRTPLTPTPGPNRVPSLPNWLPAPALNRT